MAWQVTGNLRGPEGPKGDDGDQGPKGDDGAGIELSGAVDSYADLPDDLGPEDIGTAYLVRDDGLLYIWDGTQWPDDEDGIEFRGPEGPQGPKGDEGEKGEKGDPGDKGETGNTGADGNDGAAATIAVGNTSTGAPGSNAQVSNVGTPNAAEFDFVIPRGDKGDKGDDGDDGADGTRWHFGTGAPGTVPGAIPGDAYLDTEDGTVYVLS